MVASGALVLGVHSRFLSDYSLRVPTPHLGIQLHSHVSDANTLLRFFYVFRNAHNAYKVFEQTHVRDCISYSIMINGFVRAGYAVCSLKFFGEIIYST